MSDDYPQTLVGSLLIAMPSVEDGLFARSVVLVCAHSRDGAMGLMINKPNAGLRLDAFLEGLGLSECPRLSGQAVHSGGPVEPSRGFVLHSRDKSYGADTLDVAGGFALTATMEVLDAIAQDTGPSRHLVALGYAGWGAGQLDQEIRHNLWLTVKAEERLVFSSASADRWHLALGRIGVEPESLSTTFGRA